ncbi:MAG: heme-binding beta-barrel domain-containing protein [Nitrospinales bacterium]
MSEEILRHLGPLARLAGVWEGDKGQDTAPSPDRGAETNEFRERMTFEPFGPVKNHEQVLFGLRYTTTAWPLGEDQPFHEELGYWLWDADQKQVMRCFLVPRGVTILAGGRVEPDAESFALTADVGSATYGICSNRFLNEAFKTVRYELKVDLPDAQTLRYEEDTLIQIKGKPDLFHHLDSNTLRRVG